MGGTQPLFDMSQAKPIQASPLFDMSKAQPIGQAKQSDPVPSFWETLSREGKALTGSIAGLPSAVYHAFSEPPTAEEKQKYAQFELETGEAPGTETSGAKRIGLGLERLTTAPVEVAAKFYSDVAKGKYGDASAVESAMLDVAPEAIGSASGSMIVAKLASAAPGAAKAVIENTPAVVRGTVKGVNTALAKAPGVVGGTVGTGIGGYLGGHVGVELGGAAGIIAGKELLPQVTIPGEGFGLPNRVTGGPSNAPTYQAPPFVNPGAPLPENPGTFPGAPLPETPAPELLQAQPLATAGAAPQPEPAAGLGQLPTPKAPPAQLPAAFQPLPPKAPPVPGTVEAPFKSLMELPGQAVNQALQELGPKASIVNVTERANKIANLLNEGLGGKGLEPNVPLRAQQGVVTPTPKPIEAPPQTIRYMRNTEGARNFGKYTEAVPGRYMIEDADWPNSKVPDERWEQGAVTFKKPLVMDAAQFGTDNWAKADWKQVLSQRYGGKTGQPLTNALRADGYDGIITNDKYGTGEIVDLNNKAQSAPEGHTPVDSSALKSYKYDPETKEFESVTTSGAHYIHGDVSPEQAAAFESAESKGKAWNDLRKNSTLIAKVVNGKRVPVRPPSELQSSDPNDLTPQLQKMLDDALAAKRTAR